MAFQFDVKKAGDLIKSTDWNNLNTETTRLGNDKVDRAGDTIAGDLTINGKVNVSGPLSITGTSTLSGNASMGGTLSVTGIGAFNNNVNINGNLNLTANKELAFAENGQIRSGDNNHRILFRRSENKLELREFGQIIFSPGATAGAETAKMVLLENGNVGIGTATPKGFQVVLPEGSKGSPSPGITMAGGLDGNASIELRNNNSGTPYIDFAIQPGVDFDGRIRLTAPGQLAIEGANVGIGTTAPTATLEVNGTAKAREFLTTLYTAGNKAAVALLGLNTWADVADLTRTFSLAQETAVLVYYQITAPGNQHLVTRLIVDNVDVVFGRSIVGNTQYWSPSSLWIGRLAVGSHTIKVQYRTPTESTSNPSGDDWQNRVLHVLVFGS